MGKKKYLDKIQELLRKSPVVDADSIIRIVRSGKNVKQYHKQLIRNLVIGGKIKRLAKGCYTAHEDTSLAVFCFKPAYLGLQDALSIHNLWEQERIPVIITVRKVRNDIRSISGANALIRRIDKKYFFGYAYIKQGDFYFPVSDVEKTFIDMVYYNENISNELVASIKKRIDRKKLKSYLKRYPGMILKRIGKYGF